MVRTEAPTIAAASQSASDPNRARFAAGPFLFGAEMKATERDIQFARNVAGMVRQSIRPATDGDLYAACMNAERLATAALYEQAADAMAHTGAWQMPDQSALDAAKAASWARLG